MTEFQINDHLLNKECTELARDILDNIRQEMADDETLADYEDEINDRAHEAADGHSWVIYNHKALMLCAHCDTGYGDDFLSDAGFTWESDSTIYSVATMIAYGEIRGRVECIAREMIEEATEETETA